MYKQKQMTNEQQNRRLHKVIAKGKCTDDKNSLDNVMYLTCTAFFKNGFIKTY